MVLSPFFWPTVKILPLELQGGMTDYEFLTHVCQKMNVLINQTNTAGSQVSINTSAITALQQDVQNIQNEIEKVQNGDYVSLYLDSIISYINNNLQELVGNMVKFVVFGLTQDGHFAAYTPATWQFIHWDTIMDYSSPLYGHLVLRW